MKRVLITLALLALAGAAFAATINDPSVTAENWSAFNFHINCSDLTDDNGFTASTDTVDGGGGAGVMFQGRVSGWLFDPNESINVSVFDDFFGEESLFDSDMEECSILFSVGNMDTYASAQYIAPYTGSGDYTLEFVDAMGLSDGDEIKFVSFILGTYDEEEQVTKILGLPANSTITVRFNSSERPETVVPEPTAIAYGLVGLAPLFGLKKRMRK